MDITLLHTTECVTNTYILTEGDEAIVVDPGGDAERIVDAVKLKNATIKYILVTHAHHDHVGAVAALRSCGAKVVMSKTDHDAMKLHAFYTYTPFSDVSQFSVDRYVSDGDELNILGHVFKVIETPGHTPGGVCFLCDGNMLFSGDTLFRCGYGRTDLPFGDTSALVKSLEKLFALDGGITVYPGHGPRTTISLERDNRYAL